MNQKKTVRVVFRSSMKTLVGWVAIILFMALWPHNMGLIFLGVSIICTFGVTLLLWFPFAFFIGSLLFKLYYFIVKRPEPENIIVKNGQSQALTNNQLALFDYIRAARLNHLADDLIIKQLKASGWTEKDIDDAFRLCAE